MTTPPLPNIGENPDILRLAQQLGQTARALLQAQGADLGCMAIVWIATEPEGNSASALLSNDPGPDALEHMAECLMGLGDEWESGPVIEPYQPH